MKACRYAGQYCQHTSAADGYAVELGMPRAKVRQFLQTYLDSKPWLQLWKQRTWRECWRTHEARTAFGRRRRLYGDQASVEKEGLNHQIQGTVADLMKMIVRRVCEVPACLGLAYQTHDGAKFIFKNPLVSGVLDKVRYLVGGREWIIWGRPLLLPATVEVIER